MANEARCVALGANCIGSAALNTNSYSFNGLHCRPSDSNTKELSMFADTAGYLVENSDAVDMGSNWTYPNSGPLFTALPNMSPSVTRFLQGTPEPSDVNFLGHSFNSGNPTARRSLRWYHYFSTDWQWANVDGACLNRGKIFELGDATATMLFTTSSLHLASGWNQFNIIGKDCCSSGPGSGPFGLNKDVYGGKWIRFEIVVRNASGSGHCIIELWRKNVTDGGPLEKVIDTADSTYGPGTISPGDDWNATDASTLAANARIDHFFIAPWGNGTCAGFVAFSHILAAAWSSDSGQMIGAADELEGGGGSGLTIDDSAHEWYVRQAQTNPLRVSKW